MMKLCWLFGASSRSVFQSTAFPASVIMVSQGSEAVATSMAPRSNASSLDA